MVRLEMDKPRASGLTCRAGLENLDKEPCKRLYATAPAQTALSWQTIGTVASGLGNGNSENLGGLWTLLARRAALRVGGLPRGVDTLGLLEGAVGIISIFPGLVSLVRIYGLAQIIWFVWPGMMLLHHDAPESMRDQGSLRSNRPKRSKSEKDGCIHRPAGSPNRLCPAPSPGGGTCGHGHASGEPAQSGIGPLHAAGD
jgi:hypothetical protein